MFSFDIRPTTRTSTVHSAFINITQPNIIHDIIKMHQYTTTDADYVSYPTITNKANMIALYTDIMHIITRAVAATVTEPSQQYSLIITNSNDSTTSTTNYNHKSFFPATDCWQSTRFTSWTPKLEAMCFDIVLSYSFFFYCQEFVKLTNFTQRIIL